MPGLNRYSLTCLLILRGAELLLSMLRKDILIINGMMSYQIKIGFIVNSSGIVNIKAANEMDAGQKAKHADILHCLFRFS